MHIPEQQFQGYAEQRAAALSRRARMLGSGKAANDTQPAPVVKATPVQLIDRPTKMNGPLWTRSSIRFDYHILAWQLHLGSLVTSPVPKYIRARCKALGADYNDIYGPSRLKKLVAVRHLIMWELRQKFGLSYPQIGRLMGNRDHASCQHAIKKITAQRGG